MTRPSSPSSEVRGRGNEVRERFKLGDIVGVKAVMILFNTHKESETKSTGFGFLHRRGSVNGPWIARH